MIPIRHRLLSHRTSHSVCSFIQTPLRASSTRALQCQHQSCMSSARKFATSPEGTKRRKLSTSSKERFQSPHATMAPIKIQEVEDTPSPPTTLELTPVEDTLRRLLLDVAAYIDQTPSLNTTTQALPEPLASEKVTLRFTGGWVRDKLLGVPSHDIDVAINKMTGEQFGYRMKEYLEIPGNSEKYGLEGVASTDKQSQKAGASHKSKVVGGLHKIEANPEKSKHLETVTTRILGLDIDLVNLRKETYTDDSRNPQMEFGTPEEDALRRDATVNAMFYNINTGKIEDFTGQGHEDMRNKIIRTPLDPYQTFKDDPLRVLRLIRFASRLGYQIDEKALVAMKDADIKDALQRKISRERVGTEFEKSLRGPDPHEALRLIFDLDLYFTIFSDPTVPVEQHYQPDTANWQTMLECLHDITSNNDPIAEILMHEEEDNFMSWQMTAFIPYRDAPQPPPTIPGRKAPPPIAASVAREGIKATNKVGEVIIASLRHQQEISSMVDRLYQQKRRPDKVIEGEEACARDVLGMAIRRWGLSWRSQVVYSFLVDIVDGLPTNDQAVATAERKYTTFIKHLESFDLLEACTLKPLLDGKALAKILEAKPGPWMKDALEVVMAWQLRHPENTDPTEAIEAVKQARGELPHDLASHFLKLTIRPLFQKTKPSTITPSGRKNETAVLPKRLGIDDTDESVTRPWKSDKDGLGLHLLQWTLKTLDAKTIELHWPLLIPPILTLLDDWETKYRALGATLLTSLLQTTPPSLLSRTGLGPVFEAALLPSLTFLPPLTPEKETISLLSTTCPALLTLINTRFPTPDTEAEAERTKCLDTILRTGIFHAHNHAPEYILLTHALYKHLSPILDAMGLETIKHLPSLLPMLSGTLAQRPLAAAPEYRGTLGAAAGAVQAVLRNGWPRMNVHRLEVLKGVVGCWINLAAVDAKGGEAEDLKRELKIVLQVLRSIADSEEGEKEKFEKEIEALVKADQRLEGLFEES